MKKLVLALMVCGLVGCSEDAPPETSIKQEAVPDTEQKPEKIWTNYEAVTLAKETVNTIQQVKNDFKTALKTNDINGLNEYVRKPLNEVADKWTPYSNASAALNPYRECFMAINDYLQYVDTFTVLKDSVRNQKDREYSLSHFKKGLDDCQLSIKKPDMSLVDVNS